MLSGKVAVADVLPDVSSSIALVMLFTSGGLVPSMVLFSVRVSLGVGAVGGGAAVGVKAKFWVVTLPVVTTTPVVVLVWYPVALAVTVYVPAAMLML
ncbi:Uncharacterised protein [uncultured archaeon]|nr:Uncharacterised protein [uncultured archaeon]